MFDPALVTRSRKSKRQGRKIKQNSLTFLGKALNKNLKEAQEETLGQGLTLEDFEE